MSETTEVRCSTCGHPERHHLSTGCVRCDCSAYSPYDLDAAGTPATIAASTAGAPASAPWASKPRTTEAL